MSGASKYETVIGLEVHLQLNTATKIFCGCANAFGEAPNTLTCPVCLGLPGSLPVLNKKVLDHGMKIGLALNCEINSLIKFDRKNYYYPDLPKAYQISQFDFPIAKSGFLMIPQEDGTKKIRINRAHLEEDAGKLIHDDQLNASLVDYNRTGTPLMEIVTEPDLRSPQEAYDYLQTLKLTLQYLDVSDCDMEKGSLRCDANISIRLKGETKLGTKTELKNMNSFKAVKTALEYEVSRQEQMLEAGEPIVQQTLLWDENKGRTLPMRNKEEAHDYRYFPEPDLVPFTVKSSVMEEIRESLPESPEKKFNRLTTNYKLSEYDARILVQDKHLADFFEQAAKQYKGMKKLCNWINGALLQELNNTKQAVEQTPLTPENFAQLLKKFDEGTLNNLAAKEALREMIASGKDADTIIQEKGLAQVSDTKELEEMVDQLIAENPKAAQEIREGKLNAIGFLIGQAMKKTQGKANPKILQDIIKRRLS